MNLYSMLQLAKWRGSRHGIRSLILSFIGKDECNTYPLCLVNKAWLLVACRNWFSTLRVNMVAANDSKVFSADGAANPHLSKCCGNLHEQYLVQHVGVTASLSNKLRVRVAVATDFRIGRDIETNFSVAEYRFSSCSLLLSMFDAANGHKKTFIRQQVAYTIFEFLTQYIL